MRSRLLLALGLACTLLTALAWFALSDGGPLSSARRGGSSADTRGAAGAAPTAGSAGGRADAFETAALRARATASSGDADALAHTVRARLVDLGGRPLADGELDLRLGDLSATQRSNATGEVVLALELPAGAARDSEAEIAARARGCMDLLLKKSLGGGDTTWLGDLALAPGGSIAGRVVDAGGRMVPGARVAVDNASSASAEELAALRRHGPHFDFNSQWLAVRGARTTEADADGRFRFGGLAPGHVRVWAGAPGFAWSIVPSQPLRGGEEVVDLELVLEPLDPSVMLCGRVLAPDGAPVASVQVTATGPEAEFAGWDNASRTDAQGRFVLVVEDRAPRRIRIEPPRWEWEPIEVASAQPGAAELELRFVESPWLWVRVVDERGAPLTNGRVQGESTAEHPRRLPRVVSDLWPDGRARLHRPTEDFRLRLDIPGYERSLSEPFALAGLVEPIVLVARRGESLRGRVTAGGRPVAGAQVRRQSVRSPGKGYISHNWPGEGEPFVSESPAPRPPVIVTDADGRFALERREWGPSDPAQAFLRVDAEGYASSLVDCPAGDASAGAPELAVELTQGGAIRGRLLLEPEAGTAGWTVRAHDGRGAIAAADVGPDGRFSFARLHAGGWQLRAFRPGTSFLADAFSFTERELPAPDVIVLDGATADFDLRVVDRTATLAGQLSMRSGPLGAWSVRVRRAESKNVAPVVAIDPDGHFLFRSTSGGEFELYLTCSTPGFEAVEIWDRIALAPSANSWALELDLGHLRGRWAAPADAPGALAQLRHAWRGAGSLKVTTRIDVDASGAFGPAVVHAGRGELTVETLEYVDRLRALGYVGEAPAPAPVPPKTLLVDVPSGGELALDLP